MPLLHLLRQNPVIAAVKDNASLQLAIDSECQFISVLYGNICTISNIVKKIKTPVNMPLFTSTCWRVHPIKR